GDQTGDRRRSHLTSPAPSGSGTRAEAYSRAQRVPSGAPQFIVQPDSNRGWRMTGFDRRKFLKVAGAGGTAAAVGACDQPSAPAVMEAMPTLHWRLTSSFPKSLDTIYGAAETFTRVVSEMTDGRFQIQV